MSEFDGKRMRAIGFEPIYDAHDTESQFGASVELTDDEGSIVLVYQVDAFRASGLYEIVEVEE